MFAEHEFDNVYKPVIGVHGTTYWDGISSMGFIYYDVNCALEIEARERAEEQARLEAIRKAEEERLEKERLEKEAEQERVE